MSAIEDMIARERKKIERLTEGMTKKKKEFYLRNVVRAEEELSRLRAAQRSAYDRSGTYDPFKVSS